MLEELRAGPVAVLAALLRDHEGSAAAHALTRSGVTHARLLEAAGDAPQEDDGELLGFARGLAAGGGRWDVTPEDALFAVLFRNEGVVPHALERCGTTRGEIVARLRVAGVPIPLVPIPPVELDA